MQIELNNLGKQYNGEWIFKSVSLSFSSDFTYHISGGNGSGKSTLLKILAAYNLPSKGKISWIKNGVVVSLNEVHSDVAFCSPAMSLFDEHSVREAIQFHFSFKSMVEGLTIDTVLDFCYLTNHADKRISELSSGMTQRLKLSLAFLSQSSLLLLDEPCANLDAEAIKWYQEKVLAYKKDKLLIICSNNKQEEHFMCNKTIKLEDFKK